jgi:type II secretory pathway pseudopilin PulG
MSLMELMLVLAVLVAVAAMVYPALQGPMDDQRLLKTADLIRAQLTRARVAAMKNGQMYVFRYVTSGDEYAVEPWAADADGTEASQQALLGDTPALPRSTSDKLRPLGISGQRLPDNILFFSGETQMDARLAAVTSDASPSAPPEGSAPPIVFYPDGSTSDARLVLTNERFFVEVTLRGLTGMVRVSELLSAEEVASQGGGVP